VEEGWDGAAAQVEAGTATTGGSITLVGGVEEAGGTAVTPPELRAGQGRAGAVNGQVRLHIGVRPPAGMN